MNASSPEPTQAQMSLEQMKAFVRNHFEQLINQKNLATAEANFASEFVDHGTDVPAGLPPGREGTKQYVAGVLKKIPDIHVTVEDVIAEGDRIVVRNMWRGTDRDSGNKIQFGGIVIWRIAHGQFVERWAYLESPTSV
jgi:predicted SnoaL-like aldol condensation-catalyzing enzyme